MLAESIALLDGEHEWRFYFCMLDVSCFDEASQEGVRRLDGKRVREREKMLVSGDEDSALLVLFEVVRPDGADPQAA